MSDDDRTRIVRRTPQPMQPPGEIVPLSSDGEDRTRVVARRQQPDAVPLPLRGDGMTKVYQPSKPGEGPEPQKAGVQPTPPHQAEDQTKPLIRAVNRTGADTPARTDLPTVAEPPKPAPACLGSSEDPVVGWVVIVNGPGRGCSLMLGQGMNQIGRDPGQQVALDFGDEEIYREGHAQITYDPLGRKFYATHGGQRNLTYLGSQPLLQTTELKGGEEITLGVTTLRFVPFCGENFQW